MNAAEERARRSMIHEALELLLSAKPMTRAELFGDSPSSTKQFQRRVINNLVEQGIVSKQDAGGDPESPTVVIKLKDRRKLEKILADEVELTRVIWPGTVPNLVTDRPPPEVEHDAEEPTAPPPDPDSPLPAPVQFHPTPSPGLGMDQAQLLEQLLVVMNAACQSIIYTREKVDELEKKINYIYEALK